MRTIKFRAWDKVDKRMMNWVDQIHWGNIGIESIAQTTPLQSHKRKIEDVEIMQFTGLLDKNGVEIYEGDIVRNNDNFYEVYWGEGGFYLREQTTGSEWIMLNEAKHSVVSGNIYENPDLIK